MCNTVCAYMPRNLYYIGSGWGMYLIDSAIVYLGIDS